MGGAGRIAAEESLFIRLAVNVRLLQPGDEVLTRSQLVLPLDGKSYLLRRDALGASQILAVAVGSDRREGLIQVLTAGVSVQFEGAQSKCVSVPAEIKFANSCAVGL